MDADNTLNESARLQRGRVPEPTRSRAPRDHVRYGVEHDDSGREGTIPTTTIERPDVSREQAMEAVRGQLGQGYTVAPKEGTEDVFNVRTGTLTEAHVHMRREGEATQFHVHGAGIIIGRIINELGIARRVATALREAPELGSSAQPPPT